MSTPDLPLFHLRAEPATPEAEAVAGFEWAAPEIGTRHQIGGAPPEHVEVPSCPDCQEKMTFYGQLDSVGDDLAIADAGMVLVFLCFGCFEARAVVSTT